MNIRHRALRRITVTATLLATATAGCAATAVLFTGTAGAAAKAATTVQGQAAGVAPPGPATATTTATAPKASHTNTARTQATAVTHTPDPARSAQLTTSQLPAVQAERWKPVGAPSTRIITGHDITENECSKVDGATTWTQQGFSGGDGQNPAIEDTFSFPSPAAAQSAYTTFASAMAECQATTRAFQHVHDVAPDAVIRQTAAAPHAAAWERTWTGVMGISAEGPQTNHTYLAVGGTRLIVLQFTEFPGNAARYAVSSDPQILAMLDAEPAN